MADISADVKITDASKLRIRGNSNDEPVHLELRGDAAQHSEPVHLGIDKVAPVAVHLKEVNQIDPISIESLKIDEISNIDPIQVTRFNVTNLPAVNVSVRKLPDVNMHVRQLPAISVGTYQSFRVPSSYTVRAAVLGVELLRISVAGATQILPVERTRREQSRAPERSHALVATAGNPSIPSHVRPADRALGHHAEAHGLASSAHVGVGIGAPRGTVRAALAPTGGVSVARGPMSREGE